MDSGGDGRRFCGSLNRFLRKRVLTHNRVVPYGDAREETLMPAAALTSLVRNKSVVFSIGLRAGLGFLLAATLVACNRDVAVPQGAPLLELKSASFADGTIPAKYSSCAGESSVSPALAWSARPAGATAARYCEQAPDTARTTGRCRRGHRRASSW